MATRGLPYILAARNAAKRYGEETINQTKSTLMREITMLKNPGKPLCDFGQCYRLALETEYPREDLEFRENVLSTIPGEARFFEGAVYSSIVRQYSEDPERAETVPPSYDSNSVQRLIRRIQRKKRGQYSTFLITWDVIVQESGKLDIQDITPGDTVRRYCEIHSPGCPIHMPYILNRLTAAHQSSISRYTKLLQVTACDRPLALLGCTYPEFVDYLFNHNVTTPSITMHAYFAGDVVLTTKCNMSEYDLSTPEGQYSAFHFSNYILIFRSCMSLLQSHLDVLADLSTSALYIGRQEYIDRGVFIVLDHICEYHECRGTHKTPVQHKITLLEETTPEKVPKKKKSKKHTSTEVPRKHKSRDSSQEVPRKHKSRDPLTEVPKKHKSRDPSAEVPQTVDLVPKKHRSRDALTEVPKKHKSRDLTQQMYPIVDATPLETMTKHRSREHRKLARRKSRDLPTDDVYPEIKASRHIDKEDLYNRLLY